MSKQEIVPRFCPTCGKPLDNNQVCINPACSQLGVKVNLVLGEHIGLISPEQGATNQPFALNMRRIQSLKKSKNTEANRVLLRKTINIQLQIMPQIFSDLVSMEQTVNGSNIDPVTKKALLANLEGIGKKFGAYNEDLAEWHQFLHDIDVAEETNG